MRKYLPDFEYFFTDITAFPDEEIILKGTTPLVNTFLALKHGCDSQFLKTHSKIFVGLEKIVDTDYGENYLRKLGIYTFQMLQLPENELLKVIEQLSKKLYRPMMSTMEYIQKKVRDEYESKLKEKDLALKKMKEEN